MLMAGVLLLDGHGDCCRENPEMAGNLAAVREMLGNDQKFGKWPHGGGILSAGAVYCLLKVCGYVSLVGWLCFVVVKGLCCLQSRLEHIRYDTSCYINVRSKANMSQLNLPHGTDN